MIREKPRKGEPPQTTGFCPKCGFAMDDHDGLLTKQGPRCPREKEPA